LPDAAIYAELVKQQAITLGARGDLSGTRQLQAQLIRSPEFARLPLRMQADILVNLGTAHLWSGELAQARHLLEHALVITEQGQDSLPHWQHQPGQLSTTFSPPLWAARAYALNQLGCLAMFQGHFGQAEALYQACLTTLLRNGEAEHLACVGYQALGRLYLYCRREAEAVTLIEQGLNIRRAMQDRDGIATNAAYLAAALLEQRAWGRAEGLLYEALALAQELNAVPIQATVHLYFGQLAWLRQQERDAIRQWRQALRLLKMINLPLVEQRVLIRYLPGLVRCRLRLALAVARHLIHSAWRQQLSILACGRLLRRFAIEQHP
jgi:tetratricopeptide (TPR) repeat protein